jgi:sugar lactone lactonase YvrE
VTGPLRAQIAASVLFFSMLAVGPSPGQEMMNPEAPEPAEPQDAIEAYVMAMQADEAGDVQLYIKRMRQALDFQPAHPILMRHLAQGYAHLLHFETALEWLDRVLEVGADFDYDSYDDLASLREDPSWQPFLERRTRAIRPVGVAVDEISTGQRDLVPEGIAYDPREDVFYLSSVSLRKIVRLARDGATSDFIQSGQDGYLCGLGLEVDAERRQLWTCSSAFPETGLFGEDENGSAAVHRYDLESGELIAKFVLPKAEAEEGETEAAAGGSQNLNDLVVHDSGDVYVTNANNGAVYVIRRGTEALEMFLPEGSISGANGITLNEAGTALYVSKYALGVVHVDLEFGEVTDVRHPDSFTMCGVDGLYMVKGALVAVQNMAGLNRVARFRLDASGRRAVDCEVLIARQPLFVDPTTGVVAGERFYFIANSQVTPYLAQAGESSPEALDEVKILGLEL